MELYELSSGDKVHRYDKSIVIVFQGKRKVLSTSLWNGGYHEDFLYVFNHDANPGAGMACQLSAPTYEEHMARIATSIGLDPEKATGLGTAASMDNVAIVSQTYEHLTVTAIVTGGIEVNGGRVGDPASYFRPKKKDGAIPMGTINIMLCIDGDMKPGTMARALVTCTEAKTAALQELLAGSHYSTGIATGSGTDQTIIMTNGTSDWYYEDAGKHTKTGELIGQTVKHAVKEALRKQSNLCADSQHDALKRLKRYRINADTLYESYALTGGGQPKYEAVHQIEVWAQAAKSVVRTSLEVHLLDQYQWELLSEKDIRDGLTMLGWEEKELLPAGKKWTETDLIAMEKQHILNMVFSDNGTESKS